MGRYKRVTAWEEDWRANGFGPFVLQCADIRDLRTGDEYREGTFRVIDGRTGKAVRGKGGTHPFYGETAWSDAERLADDLWTAERFAR
jgi:hypothetical protein